MKKHTLVSIFLIFSIVLTLFIGSAAASGSSFNGTYTDDNTVIFDRCVLVYGVQLPDGSDITQNVVCTTDSILSFTITAPGYAKNGSGKVFFTVQLDALDMYGVTWRGVQLYQGDTPLTTYLYGRDSETAYYMADITSPGTFTIKFEEGATQDLPVKGDITRYQETQSKKTASSTPVTTAASSPVPVFAILAGLGAAAIFVACRRH